MSQITVAKKWVVIQAISQLPPHLDGPSDPRSKNAPTSRSDPKSLPIEFPPSHPHDIQQLG